MGSDNATDAAAEEPEAVAREPDAVARSDYSWAAALGRSVSGDGRTSAVGPLLLATDAEAAATASATLGTPHYYFFHGPSLSRVTRCPNS